MEVSIKGQPWKIMFHTTKKYNKVLSNYRDSTALTDVASRLIHFRQKECSPEIVIHELIHAFVSETHTESMDLTAEATEEMIASLIAVNYFEIGALANKIITGLFLVLNVEKKKK